VTNGPERGGLSRVRLNEGLGGWFDNEERTMQWKTLAQAEPADGQLCAVYDPQAAVCHIWPARWDASMRCFDAAAGWFEPDEVKAWMPMPEPPNVISPTR